MRTIAFRLFVAAAVLVACVTVPAGSAPRKTVGVSLLTQKHEFYSYLENGLRAAARENGFSLIVKAGEYDIDTQMVQVRQFIARKVQAIVLTPCDSRGIGNVIAEANAAAIPVFTVDIANLSARGSVVAHIASDNVDGGRKAAALMVRALADSGKIVIINHPNVTSVMDRVAGFREVMSGHPGIRIIAEVPAWGLRDRAMSIMEDILVKIADVNGVFAINDNSALGALDALNAAGKKTILIGYDAIPEVRKAISQGAIFGAIIQYPEKIGATTIETIAAYFDGKKVPPAVIVPVGVLTRDGR